LLANVIRWSRSILPLSELSTTTDCDSTGKEENEPYDEESNRVERAKCFRQNSIKSFQQQSSVTRLIATDMMRDPPAAFNITDCSAQAMDRGFPAFMDQLIKDNVR
jgi:hypothetical protein